MAALILEQESKNRKIRGSIRLQEIWWRSRIFNSKNHLAQQKKRASETSSEYSCRPFDQKKAIFIHVPKCAGVSVNQTLFGNLAGGHTSLEQYASIFEPKRIQQYFIFTFIRNPWDRLLSAYLFLKKGGFNESDRIWAERELSNIDTFEEFIMKWINAENIWKWHHFKPQIHFITDSKKILSPDFIGLYENINQDFKTVSEFLGIREELPFKNTNNHQDYRSYYTKEMIDRVYEVYQEDIEHLGYDFNNSNLSEQLSRRKSPKPVIINDHSLKP